MRKVQITKFYKSIDELPVQMDLACLSRLTGLSPEWIRQLCKSGQLPAYQIGRTWYVDKDDYIAWKNDKKQKCREVS